MFHGMKPVALVIMNTDDNNRIIEFEEKPARPKSNHASMGIYIFNWQRLRSVLINGFTKEIPMIDFGKNVIPFYIKSGDNVFAYNFAGYWKDVGTIQSLWEANMEFIDGKGGLNISDRSWRIFSKNPIAPPQFITDTATVSDSMIVDGCFVAGKIDHSILSANVQVKENSLVKNSVIMPDCSIGKNVKISHAIIGENSVIGDNAVIAGTDEVAVVGNNEVIGVKSNED